MNDVALKRVTFGVEQGWSPDADGFAADADEIGVLRLDAIGDGHVDLERSKRILNPGSLRPDWRRFVVADGDLLVTRASGSLHRLGMVGLASVPRGLLRIYPDLMYRVRPRHDRSDQRYLLYVLSSPIATAQYRAAKRGAANNKLRLEDVAGLRLPAMPLGSQRIVADFLDRECARLLALDKRLEQFNARVDDQLTSHVDETLRGLGSERRPLAWAVDPARPIMYGIVLPGEPAANGILLVKGGNVERDQLLPEHLVRVAPEIEARYARARLRGGDLLVTIRGSWGATAQLPPESDGANITQDTARVSPGSHVDAKFLLYALRSPSSQNWLGSMVRGTGVKGINIFDLRRLMLPIPPLERQRDLATAFDAWSNRNKRLTTVVDQTRARLAEYRDALITEAVMGHLDLASMSDAHMNERAHAAAEGAVARTPTLSRLG